MLLLFSHGGYDAVRSHITRIFYIIAKVLGAVTMALLGHSI